jgi:hypothetical protein
MEARLQRDVFDLNPQVVILQTGTIEGLAAPNAAARSDFRARLRSVVSAMKQRLAVVLMNSQHYPGQPADYVGYQDIMEEVSVERDVPIFDRYALMKSWIDSGKYKYSEILASDSFHMNDFSYRCTAQFMAELILSGSSDL